MAVTDLTGTKWEIKKPSEFVGVGYNGTSPLNFQVELTYKMYASGYESAEQNNLTISQTFSTSTGNLTRTILGSIPPYVLPRFGIIAQSGFNTVQYLSSEDTSDNVYLNDIETTIEITGGAGATNSDLISWLQANATQIQEQSNTISFGNLPIANMYFGTQQVKKVYLGNTLVWEKEEPQPTIDPVLANNSWDVIKSVCEAGQAANHWSLGATKTDVGTDGVTRTFRIADMQGLYGKHVVFEQVEIENTSQVWNPSSNVDGDNCYNNYSISQMRTTHLPALLAKYSNSLQSVITNTKYKVATNGNNGTLLELEDKLFLPAEREIFSSRSYSRTEEWNALTRFQLYAANDTSTFRKKYKPGAASATIWWLRSPYSGYASFVCGVHSIGIAGNGYAYDSYGVSPFFSL